MTCQGLRINLQALQLLDRSADFFNLRSDLMPQTITEQLSREQQIAKLEACTFSVKVFKK